jgi:lipid A 4'-phosphatase
VRKLAFENLNPAFVETRRPVARSNTNQALAVIGTSIIWVSFIFVVFPTIDLAVSRSFAEGPVFFLAELPFFKGVRDFGRQSQPYLLSAMLSILLLQVILPKRLRFCQPHKPFFVLLSFAAGPLVIVQTLKVLIGRVRPRALVEFGGSADFTPVWQFSVACERNCSFPSGEASAAAAALSVLVFIPAGLRWIAAMVLTPCLAMIAFNRVIFGAHFLSDVMLGWLITIFVMGWVWSWIDAHSKKIDRVITASWVK